MPDPLATLAAAAGVATSTQDAFGREYQISPATLRAVLAALGLPAATSAEVAWSLAALRRPFSLPPLLTAEAGSPVMLAAAAGRFRVHLEAGGIIDGCFTPDAAGRVRGPTVAELGYHRMETETGETLLAVAPRRCFGLAHSGGQRLWGLSVPVYGLRRAGDLGVGDYPALAQFAAAAGAYGAAAVAISPVHAAFAAEPDRFSPYAPSSRALLNVLHADPASLPFALPAHVPPEIVPRKTVPPEAVPPKTVPRKTVSQRSVPQRAALPKTVSSNAAPPENISSTTGSPASGPPAVGPGADAGDARAQRKMDELIDYPAAARARMQRLRAAFAAFGAAPAPAQAAFAAFRAARGETLERHARFEALHGYFLSRDPACRRWQDWPAPYHDPAGPEVAAFAAAHAAEVAFHAFLQFLADAGLAAAQAAARAAGMPIGLIADLAVGTDPAGSHAWSRPAEMLSGLSIGAPPDLWSRRGQDWGLVGFSPAGLRASGYAGFIEMLRAVLRHAGGVRIDHVLGLCRLWVIPEGAAPTEGTYLAAPETDLLRLVALESVRHRAVVLGEDLGTVPPGLRARLRAAGLMGLRLLIFERDDAGFIPPDRWEHGVAAMTTTHDLPTISGWWQERDIAWRARLGLADVAATRAERTRRAEERKALWAAFRVSGAATGRQPGRAGGTAAVDAACAHLGATASDLALLPIEDALALDEQPNLPGTIDGHPNWRRRLPGPAGQLLDAPAVRRRLAALGRGRTRR
ncbi:MAG: 4-alpha-glucanotransferase [Acetobacteraceae bacterium]